MRFSDGLNRCPENSLAADRTRVLTPLLYSAPSAPVTYARQLRKQLTDPDPVVHVLPTQPRPPACG